MQSGLFTCSKIYRGFLSDLKKKPLAHALPSVLAARGSASSQACSINPSPRKEVPMRFLALLSANLAGR